MAAHRRMRRVRVAVSALALALATWPAFALSATAAALAIAVLAADRWGSSPVYAAGILYAVLVVVTVAKLETPPWAPRPQSSA